MTRNPRCCNPIGTEPPALLGSREAPTTAIVVALSRISCELRPIPKNKRLAALDIPGLYAKQWLPGGVSPDLLARESIRAGFHACDVAGDVRSDEDARRLP